MRFQNSNSKTYFPERVTCCSATVRATALTTAGERTTQFWAEKPLLGKGRGAGWSWPEGPPAPTIGVEEPPWVGVLRRPHQRRAPGGARRGPARRPGPGVRGREVRPNDSRSQRPLPVRPILAGAAEPGQPQASGEDFEGRAG